MCKVRVRDWGFVCMSVCKFITDFIIHEVRRQCSVALRQTPLCVCVWVISEMLPTAPQLPRQDGQTNPRERYCIRFCCLSVISVQSQGPLRAGRCHRGSVASGVPQQGALMSWSDTASLFHSPALGQDSKQQLNVAWELARLDPVLSVVWIECVEGL